MAMIGLYCKIKIICSYGDGLMKKVCFISFLTLFYFQVLSAQETQILVLGTIHQQHRNNPNYSYQDILNILDSYKPNGICVEILPSHFRKVPYLPEMMLATLYGLENKREVYPIDWYDTTKNARKERAEYVKTDEFKQKEKEEKTRLEKDEIIQSFEKKHGNLEKLFTENNKGYNFYNGAEYNEYVKHLYKASIDTYGDSCINLYSQMRNQNMFELIKGVISKNKGRRLIVLTGAEHKYYFDMALSNMSDVKLIQLKDFSIKKVKPSKNIAKFFDIGVPKGYLLDNDASSMDSMYISCLTPLIHGPNMDENPHIIPKENVKKALLILNEWKKDNGVSVLMEFEKAWVFFLKKDYKASIKTYLSISDKLENVLPNMKWFVMIFYRRNLGFAYDMMGKREEAISCYIECKKACEKMGIPVDMAKNIYKNYEEKPYKCE